MNLCPKYCTPTIIIITATVVDAEIPKKGKTELSGTTNITFCNSHTSVHTPSWTCKRKKKKRPQTLPKTTTRKRDIIAKNNLRVTYYTDRRSKSEKPIAGVFQYNTINPRSRFTVVCCVKNPNEKTSSRCMHHSPTRLTQYITKTRNK